MELRTKTGRLTAYALLCGYTERREHEGVCTTLWAEHGHYHVRQHDHNAKGTPAHNGDVVGRVFWEVFDRVSEARNLFNRQPGRVH